MSAMCDNAEQKDHNLKEQLTTGQIKDDTSQILHIVIFHFGLYKYLEWGTEQSNTKEFAVSWTCYNDFHC